MFGNQRLHEEIVSFVKAMSLDAVERQQREDALQQVKDAVATVFEGMAVSRLGPVQVPFPAAIIYALRYSISGCNVM